MSSSDYVVQGKNRSIRGGLGWPVKRLFEDVNFAILAELGVSDHEPCGSNVDSDDPYLPATLGQAGHKLRGKVFHRDRTVGGHVDITAETIDQAVRVNGVPPVMTNGKELPITRTSRNSRLCRSLRFTCRPVVRH